MQNVIRNDNIDLANSKVREYTVVHISSTVGKQYIKDNHYSHGIHNGAMCFGLIYGETLIGVCAFATPCSENVCSSIFGYDERRSITELHRLHILDGTPKNAESYFIVRALKGLKKYKPKYNAVITFADSTVGHNGTIYKATSAYRIGKTKSSATFYLDENNRLRHPRQNGINITKENAEKMGWKPIKRSFKYRYLYLLANDKRHKRELIKMCKYDI
jgi:hypothetical protein